MYLSFQYCMNSSIIPRLLTFSLISSCLFTVLIMNQVEMLASLFELWQSVSVCVLPHYHFFMVPVTPSIPPIFFNMTFICMKLMKVNNLPVIKRSVTVDFSLENVYLYMCFEISILWSCQSVLLVDFNLIVN